MNRIAQHQFSPESVNGLGELHDLFVLTLGNSVPPSVAALYAIPQVNAQGEVLFISSFAGQPTAYRELSPPAARELSILLFDRLSAIKQFASAYAAQPGHNPAVLQHLRQASEDPPIEAVYSVGGQPVLLFWDKAIPSQAIREKLIAPISLVASTEVAGRRGLWWLFALALLLLVLAAIWWFWCPRSPFNRVELPIQPPVIEPVAVVTPEPPPEPVLEPTPTKPIPVPEPPKPEPEPEPVPKPADLPIIDPEPEPVPEPEPAPAPEPILVPEPSKPPKPVPPPPKPKPVAKPPATITTAKNLCPEDRPAALAPEMVVVFDSSGSMMVNINATREDEQWLFAKLNRPQAIQYLSGQDRQRFEYLTRQPTRMTTAQQATIDVMKRLPSDIGSGLVVVDDCPTANNIGRFSPSERGAMINQLRGLRPRQGTPLADGILEAGKLVDGVNKESTILLVSDGGESCGGDPCLVARNLARQKPHLKINVVDIGGTGAAACVAQATGGKVYSVSSIAELNAGINSAAKDALGPSTCKK